MATDALELSIVIPVYNEEPNLPEMIRRTLAACEAMKRSWEIILVDDGSTDRSVSLIEEASRNHPGKIIGVILTTNFGQHAAVTAGLAQSRKAMTLSAPSGKTEKTPSSASLPPIP